MSIASITKDNYASQKRSMWEGTLAFGSAGAAIYRQVPAPLVEPLVTSTKYERDDPLDLTSRLTVMGQQFFLMELKLYLDAAVACCGRLLHAAKNNSGYSDKGTFTWPRKCCVLALSLCTKDNAMPSNPFTFDTKVFSSN